MFYIILAQFIEHLISILPEMPKNYTEKNGKFMFFYSGDIIDELKISICLQFKINQ